MAHVFKKQVEKQERSILVEAAFSSWCNIILVNHEKEWKRETRATKRNSQDLAERNECESQAANKIATKCVMGNVEEGPSIDSNKAQPLNTKKEWKRETRATKRKYQDIAETAKIATGCVAGNAEERPSIDNNKVQLLNTKKRPKMHCAWDIYYKEKRQLPEFKSLNMHSKEVLKIISKVSHFFLHFWIRF